MKRYYYGQYPNVPKAQVDIAIQLAHKKCGVMGLGMKPTDNGYNYAHELMVHYMVGQGKLFRRSDGNWGKYLKSLSGFEGQVGAGMKKEAQALSTVNKIGDKGKVTHKMLGGLKVDENTAMLNTLNWVNVSVSYTYKVVASKKKGGCKRIIFEPTKYQLIDPADLHPGQYMSDLQDSIAASLLPYAGTYDVLIDWSTKSAVDVGKYAIPDDAIVAAFDSSGWPSRSGSIPPSGKKKGVLR